MIDAETLVSRKQQWAEPTKPHEERCSWCGALISVSPTSPLEYGYHQDCPRRPDEWPRIESYADPEVRPDAA